MKNEGAREVTLYRLYFRRSGAANFVVSGRMWPKLKLIQPFMFVFIPAKKRKIHLKMKALEW